MGVTAGEVVTPADVDGLASLLERATREGLAVRVVGGGTHSGFGDPEGPDVVVSTAGLAGVHSWEPDDLTIVVGAGARVADTEAMLRERQQTMVLPEHPGEATIGGILASGVSSLRRGRLYPTRDRVLETIAVTGDGRVVRSGGRVVKNVTGYDLSRLHVGAFGSLGVIVSVCLKLWPVPPASATVNLADPSEADRVVRPLAVLQDRSGTRLYLSGTEREVEALVSRFDGPVSPGLAWPEDPAGPWRWSLRVPPASMAEAIGRIPSGWDYLAVHGVGEVRAASAGPEGAADLRGWAESLGGRLVVVERPEGASFDPWGAPPPGLHLQRRLIEAFDPARVLNRGFLPGGI